MENEIKNWILKKAMELTESFLGDLSFVSDEYKFKITNFVVSIVRDMLDLHEEETVFVYHKYKKVE